MRMRRMLNKYKSRSLHVAFAVLAAGLLMLGVGTPLTASADEAPAAAAAPAAEATPAPAAAAAAPAAPTEPQIVTFDKINSGDTAWMLTSTALVLMMTIPGLALFYGGMVRKKNVLATL